MLQIPIVFKSDEFILWEYQNEKNGDLTGGQDPEARVRSDNWYKESDCFTELLYTTKESVINFHGIDKSTYTRIYVEVGDKVHSYIVPTSPQTFYDNFVQ